jgi:hypothetical protein
MFSLYSFTLLLNLLQEAASCSNLEYLGQKYKSKKYEENQETMKNLNVSVTNKICKNINIFEKNY